MPIYEYTCTECDHDFEEIVFSARAKVACPECSSSKVKRQLSVFSSPADRSAKAAGAGGGCGGCGPNGCGCH